MRGNWVLAFRIYNIIYSNAQLARAHLSCSSCGAANVPVHTVMRIVKFELTEITLQNLDEGCEQKHTFSIKTDDDAGSPRDVVSAGIQF